VRFPLFSRSGHCPTSSRRSHYASILIVDLLAGRLTPFCNNAGRNLPTVPLEDVPLVDLQSIVNVDLVAPLFCTRRFCQDPNHANFSRQGTLVAGAMVLSSDDPSAVRL
jgi:NAD(P)-dependent dehydrogenase (short-subunit alcohol dehydrogenase family)